MILRAADRAVDAFAVISGSIRLPRIGAWTADLLISSPAAMSGKVDLVLSSSLTLKGTVARAGVLEQVLHARVVGGGNGLRSNVRPKHYTAPNVRVVLSDLLADVGETLSTSSDRAVLTSQLQHWSTFEMPAAAAIRCVLERAGVDDVAWRILPDGTFWVGSETWPKTSVSDFIEVEGSSPETEVLDLAMVAPGLLPGTELSGQRIDGLEYTVNGGKVRAVAWLI